MKTGSSQLNSSWLAVSPATQLVKLQEIYEHKAYISQSACSASPVAKESNAVQPRVWRDRVSSVVEFTYSIILQTLAVLAHQQKQEYNTKLKMM